MAQTYNKKVKLKNLGQRYLVLVMGSCDADITKFIIEIQ